MISFVIPSKNSEHYLAECLNSLIHQTYKKIEVILVDDFSDDDTERLVRHYEKKFPFVKYIKNEVPGRANARQLGMEKCSGEILCIQDADDFSHKDRARTTFAMLKNHDVLVGVAVVVNQINKIIGRIESDFNFNDFLKTGVLRIPEPFMAVRKEKAMQVGFSEEYGQHGLELWHFFLECYVRKFRIRKTKKEVGFYRSHDGNTSRGRNPEIIREIKYRYIQDRFKGSICANDEHGGGLLPDVQLCERHESVQSGECGDGNLHGRGSYRACEVAVGT
mgnify:CR=1 FL=1